jgi:hypothetical protein
MTCDNREIIQKENALGDSDITLEQRIEEFDHYGLLEMVKTQRVEGRMQDVLQSSIVNDQI